MAYRDRQTSTELLQTAANWESLRSAFWSRLRPDLSRECEAKAQGHLNRLQVELRAQGVETNA